MSSTAPLPHRPRNLILSPDIESDGPSPVLNSMIQFGISVIDRDTRQEVDFFKRNIKEEEQVLPEREVTNQRIANRVKFELGISDYRPSETEGRTLSEQTWQSFWMLDENLKKWMAIHQDKDARTPAEFIREFMNWLDRFKDDNVTWVFYGSWFDWMFINACYYKHLYAETKRAFVKFPICSDSIESMLPDFKLKNQIARLVKQYNIQGEGEHDALWDARVQGFYFLELTEKKLTIAA